MRKGIIILFIFLGMSVFFLTGCFETTQVRTARLGDGIQANLLDMDDLNSPVQRFDNTCQSVNNICLDGDGVN